MTPEELNDLRDKVGTVYSSMLRGMLKVNEIPEAVLVRFFVIKKVIDKIDGRLSAGDLLRIAMDVGFNPETGLFEKGPQPFLSMYTKESQDRIRAASDGEMVPVELKTDEKPETVVDLTAELTATDEKGEDIMEPDAVAPDEPEAVTDEVDDDEYEDEPETIPEPIEIAEPEEDEIIVPEQAHEIGATVSAFVDGNVVDGVIRGYDDGDYTLEVDGQNFTVTEDDID